MKRALSLSIEDYILDDWPFEEGKNWNALEVSSVVSAWARPGRWLDLGCGPMLTVWPMFCDGVREVWGCDRHWKVAHFHASLKNKPPAAWPVGLRNAVEFFNRSRPKHSERTLTTIELVNSVVTGNVTIDYPAWHASFDTVIQVGCFGCLNSVDELCRAIELVSDYLVPGGRFISVTWTPRLDSEESEIWGGEKISRISALEFCDLVKLNGLEVNCMRVAKVDDAFHDQRFVIVATKSQ